jgi:hypothetical protein
MDLPFIVTVPIATVCLWWVLYYYSNQTLSTFCRGMRRYTNFNTHLFPINCTSQQNGQCHKLATYVHPASTSMTEHQNIILSCPASFSRVFWIWEFSSKVYSPHNNLLVDGFNMDDLHPRIWFPARYVLLRIFIDTNVMRKLPCVGRA